MNYNDLSKFNQCFSSITALVASIVKLCFKQYSHNNRRGNSLKYNTHLRNQNNVFREANSTGLADLQFLLHL